MTLFERETRRFFERLENHRQMVLSTSLNDRVTSRMMSILVLDNLFYFQTDRTFRKYGQLQKNPRVSLCADNLQIEGVCGEIGRPAVNPAFCAAYRSYFSSAYERYTNLENERLFAIRPLFIQQWIYENGDPFVMQLDFETTTFDKKAYTGQ